MVIWDRVRGCQSCQDVVLLLAAILLGASARIYVSGMGKLGFEKCPAHMTRKGLASTKDAFL